MALQSHRGQANQSIQNRMIKISDAYGPLKPYQRKVSITSKQILQNLPKNSEQNNQSKRPSFELKISIQGGGSTQSQTSRQTNKVKVPLLEDQFDKSIYDKKHQLTVETRACMIDWMIQILRVLDNKSDRTLFLATSILDRFFEQSAQKNRLYHSEDIQLYGLVSCFIASKVEETEPIEMTQVLFEIAHGKFRHREILEAEKKICQVLRYRILSETLIDRAHEILDQTLNHKSFINFKQKIYR